MVNISPANAGDVRDVIQSLGREDHLEEDMGTHSSILAWRITWTEEPGRLQSVHGGHKESDTTEHIKPFYIQLAVLFSFTRI